MHEQPTLDHAPAPEDDFRRRLVNRIVIAALLVVGLLGSLVMFESIYETPAPPVAAKLTLPPKQEPAAVPEAKPEPAAAAKPAEEPVPERTAAPSTPQAAPVHVAPVPHAAPQRAPASRPVTQTVERRYALQMGVFGNMANAEDLRAKLVAGGIPATIEARVSVGPFRTRQEVDAARARLKELGLDDGLLITIKK